LSVIKNSLYNVAYQMITIAIPIITLPYVSRVLGENGIGEYAYTNAIVQYFILIGILGINTYGSRQVAYVRDNHHLLSKTFWELMILRLITCGISYIAYIFIFVVFNEKNSLIYFLQSLYLIAAMVDISWLFIGIEDFKKTVTRNFIIKIIGVVCIFVFVKSPEHLTRYIFILGFTQLLGQLVMWKYVPQVISFTHIKNISIKTHIIPCIRLFVPQIAAQVYLLLDKIMLGYLVNNYEVGLYDNAQKIIRISMTLVTSIGAVLVPRMANLFSRGEMKEFEEKVYSSFSLLNLIAIPMAFGLIAIVYNIKPILYGEGFNGIENIIIINSFIIVFGTWCNVFGFQCLLPMGKDNWFTKSVVIGAAINLVLNILLIKNLKSIGTSMSSLVAEFIVPMIQLYFIRDFIDVKKLFKSIINYVLCSLAMFMAIKIITVFMSHSIITVFVQVLVGITVYVVGLILVKDKNINLVLNTIFKN
jgi:O-antigen/teichoic acid export membrane protein